MKIWKNVNFQKIFWLSCLIWISQGIYTFVLPLFILERTNSVIEMSIARSIEFIPNILLAPVIGIIIDRLNTKKILVTSLLMQFISLFSLSIVLIFTKHEIAVYLGIFIFMLFNLTFNNIRTLVIKSNIPHEKLVNANSHLQSVMQVLQVSTPFFAGFALFYFGFGGTIALSLTIILIAIFIGISIKLERRIVQNKMVFNINEIFIKPLKVVYLHSKLFKFTILAMLINIAEGSSNIAYIFLLKTKFLMTNAEMGAIFAISAFGAVLGGYFAPKIRRKFISDEKASVFILGLIAIVYILLYFQLSLVLVLSSMLIQNICFTIMSIYIWTIRQEEASHENIGRITGITSAIFKLGMPFSIVISGFLSSSHFVNLVFILCFASLILGLFIINPYLKNKFT